MSDPAPRPTLLVVDDTEDIRELLQAGLSRHETAPGATVDAPSGGYIEYAGPIENMGQVVIINVCDNNRVVLSGMAALVVHSHDVVAAHDKIGKMSADDRVMPHLYMELRCGETPVNPGQVITLAMR